jgi:amidase
MDKTISQGEAVTSAVEVAMSGPLAGRDALGLAELVRNREVSALELLDASIARAEAVNPQLNFMAQKLYDRAYKQIAKGLPDGPFTGVPWLLKDLNTHIAGEHTGQGSRFFADYRPVVTSELVKRQEAAGLVIFGKTTTPEFGLSATTESLATGATRNPWNVDRIAGGSSGGSAAAVAAGVVPAAHATDGGGSIRIPASCCGLFGLKPSRGRVPMGPLLTEGWGGLATHHAVTKTVRDSAGLLDATHGTEPGSRYGAPTPAGSFLAEVTKSPRQLKIAMMLSPVGGTLVDKECVAATVTAAKLCEQLGHIVEEVSPKIDTGALGQAVFAITAASVAVEIEERAKITGVTPSSDMLEAMTLVFHDIGQKLGGMDVVRANNTMQKVSVKMAQFMNSFDMILSPTLAAPPARIGLIGFSAASFELWGKALAEFTPFTGIYNVTGQPSMSVPLGVSPCGLPLGVMFSGRYGEDATLFRLAGQLELAAPWLARHSAIV